MIKIQRSDKTRIADTTRELINKNYNASKYYTSVDIADYCEITHFRVQKMFKLKESAKKGKVIPPINSIAWKIVYTTPVPTEYFIIAPKAFIKFCEEYRANIIRRNKGISRFKNNY